MNTGQLVKAKSNRVPFIYHYGLLAVDEKDTVWIIHNSPKEPSIIELFHNFKREREIINIQDTALVGSSYQDLMSRYKMCKKPYHVLTYNCEHFISCMLGERMRSKQIEFWTMPILAILLLKIR